jgi:hypothetical protein
VRKFNLTTCLLLITVLTGCAGFQSFPDPPFAMKDQLESTKFAFSQEAYDSYYGAPIDKQKPLRNKILNAQIRAYDIKFSEYEQTLYEMGIGLGVGTDWASLALSGLTATVGGTAVKAAFGAANAGLVGAKGSIDKHLFMEKTLPVILTEIASQRAAVLLQIRSGLRQEVSDYALGQGLSDMLRYQRAGSIASGLNGLLASSGEKLNKSEEKLNKLATFNLFND